MSFEERCAEADRRYQTGKAPQYISADRWARARDTQRKLYHGSIPSTWDDNERWPIERLYWQLQRVAEQRRLRGRRAKPHAIACACWDCIEALYGEAAHHRREMLARAKTEQATKPKRRRRPMVRP
jgi:hypothetical protein